jgi:hypothetical protein
MGTYRESRNIESSTIDWLQDILLEHDWKNITIEKAFKRVYAANLPVICVNVTSTESVRKEVGSKDWINYYTLSFRIFGENDGQREDLTDFLVDELENDVDYYEYKIHDGQVSEKELSGRICLLKILRNEKEFVNTELLDKEDRYRQLLTINCYIAKQEN